MGWHCWLQDQPHSLLAAGLAPYRTVGMCPCHGLALLAAGSTSLTVGCRARTVSYVCVHILTVPYCRYVSMGLNGLILLCRHAFVLMADMRGTNLRAAVGPYTVRQSWGGGCLGWEVPGVGVCLVEGVVLWAWMCWCDVSLKPIPNYTKQKLE